LCELIALGCLTAHGEIGATQANKVQKEYAADRIISQLEALHPNFYPHAIRLSVVPGGTHFDRLESGFLTKADQQGWRWESHDSEDRGKMIAR